MAGHSLNTMSKSDRKKKLALNKALIQKLLFPYGMKLIDAHPVKAGIENSSSFVSTAKGKFVLRVYRQTNKTPAWIKRELDFMSFMNERGIPIPKVFLNNRYGTINIYKKDEKIWRYILIERAPGRHLKGTDHNLVPQLAYCQAVLHKSSVQFAKKYQTPGNFIEGPLNYFVSEMANANKSKISKSQFWTRVKVITNEIIKEMEGDLGRLKKLPHGLVHLDYDSDNILVTKNKIEGIIDFDDLSHLPFVVDLANTLWWWAWTNRNKNPEKVIKRYLDYYRRERPLSKNELSFLTLFMRLRNIAVGIVFGVKREKNISSVAANKVIEFDKVIKSLKLI